MSTKKSAHRNSYILCEVFISSLGYGRGVTKPSSSWNVYIHIYIYIGLLHYELKCFIQSFVPIFITKSICRCDKILFFVFWDLNSNKNISTHVTLPKWSPTSLNYKLNISIDLYIYLFIYLSREYMCIKYELIYICMHVCMSVASTIWLSQKI